MPHYRATNLTTDEVIEYDADLPQAAHLTAGWRLTELVTVEPAPGVPTDTRVYGGRRRLTKLEFLGLLTDEEYVGILMAAKQSVQIEAWIEKMKLATPEADGTSVDLDDPRTQGGVQALEVVGLLAAGRAEVILNG